MKKQMKKQDLVDIIAGAADITKAAAENALNAFTETVMKELKDGGEVAIAGFGGFKTSERAARTGRNPQTGAVIEIPKSTIPKFKPGKKFKDMVNIQ